VQSGEARVPPSEKELLKILKVTALSMSLLTDTRFAVSHLLSGTVGDPALKRVEPVHAQGPLKEAAGANAAVDH
jgi:hypothetical protein